MSPPRSPLRSRLVGSVALTTMCAAACVAVQPSPLPSRSSRTALDPGAARRDGDGNVSARAGGRVLDARDIEVPEGYTVEAVAAGFTSPTGIAFDDDGTPWVVERGFASGGSSAPARLLRVGVDVVDVVAVSDGHGWMGVEWADGAFFVAEAGITRPGRILRITPDGAIAVVVDGLPSLGDHQVSGPAVKDGWVYFGVGTATNAGIVGVDDASGWLRRARTFHDIPCQDVSLRGVNVRTDDPLTDVQGDIAVTGAFVPFGTPTEHGQIVRGRLPCTGAVLRVPTTGAGPNDEHLELVAWGFRNPIGLAFAPDGRLFVTDDGADEGGSRPIFGAADMLWVVREGAWHGWPDYVDGRPVFAPRDARAGTPMTAQLLAGMPAPPRPRALFAERSSSNGLALSSTARFGHVGEVFVAQLGDQGPEVVRVDPASGVVRDFAVNAAPHEGPASRGLERPVTVRFDPEGASLWIVDFGVVSTDGDGARPVPRSGALWRVARTEELLAQVRP